jgi:D-alanyl-lipoteichoic acid acyltransferase DltB (MBOAT superfamily)
VIFHSLDFVVFFLVVTAIYWTLPRRGQNALLLVASYFFYGYWDWRFLFLMLFSTVADYTAALLIAGTGSRLKRKSVLVTSIIVQLTLLGLFKYYGFFSQQLASLFGFVGIPVYVPVLKFLLPVGISFYTFQTMSYMLDVYRDEYPAEKSFVNFALFVSFFPHLVAGPLVRATKLLPQIATPRVRRPDDFREGLYYIAIGLFKKVFVGDNLAAVANSIFQANPHSLTGLECIAGIYAFAFQIYCDFSGYSSIAQGLAKWLNIDLTTNFNLPYFATSPTEFWRRWHISLSTWFRDYLYIPLLKRGPQPATRARLFASLIVVMLLSGLWHGAAWTFVLWGLYHGVLLVGQAPGVREPVAGKPFAWTAGKTLFRWFEEAVGLTEEAVRKKIYFAAVCRCFPGKAPGGNDRSATIRSCSISTSLAASGSILIESTSLLPLICTEMMPPPAEAMRSSSAVRSSPSVTGLIRYPAGAAERAGASPANPDEESITTGSAAKRASRAILSARPGPSRPGMWWSVRTRWKGRSAACAFSRSSQAARPSRASTGSAPVLASMPSRMRRLVSLSSATRTRSPRSRLRSATGSGASVLVWIPKLAVK